MPAESAVEDACAMEHSLSPQGMDRMVRFFEFLNNCSDGQRLLDLFHGSPCTHQAVRQTPRGPSGATGEPESERAAAERGVAAAGSRARVVQITGVGPLRDRLLDMGLLPDVVVEVARAAAGQI